MRKVVLTGSESSGKTELTRRLGAHFGAPVSAEYVRERARTHPDELGFEFQLDIAKGQIALEDAAIARAKELVFLDTDLVSTVVYAEHYFGRCPPWIVEQAHARLGDLYLLLEPDIPWVPDGVRDRGHRRDELHSAFTARLDALGARYVRIGGEHEARFAAALQAIGATDAST
jgi:HTH-type transcriptional regulator, transcriptional repressor of NAD biosynthesis genes